MNRGEKAGHRGNYKRESVKTQRYFDNSKAVLILIEKKRAKCKTSKSKRGEGLRGNT